MGGTRKIAAILVADIVGYSRLAGTDEDRTLSRLRGLRSDLIDPVISSIGRARFGRGCIIGTELGRNCATSRGTSIWGTSTGRSYTDEEYQRYLGWEHSTYRHAFEFGAQVGAKQIVPSHLDLSRDDEMLDRFHENAVQRIKSNFDVCCGREGAVFNVE